MPVASTSGAGAIVSVTVPEPVWAGFELSVALTVTVAVPAAVGVPLTTQLAESESPAGKEPDTMAQEYGEIPPVTPMVAE